MCVLHSSLWSEYRFPAFVWCFCSCKMDRSVERKKITKFIWWTLLNSMTCENRSYTISNLINCRKYSIGSHKNYHNIDVTAEIAGIESIDHKNKLNSDRSKCSLDGSATIHVFGRKNPNYSKLRLTLDDKSVDHHYHITHTYRVVCIFGRPTIFIKHSNHTHVARCAWCSQ